MKRKLSLFWLLVAGLALSFALFYTTLQPTEPSLAAPRSDHLHEAPLPAFPYISEAFSPLAQSAITCTLTVTTTDDGLDNHSFPNAATLDDYDNLALAPGGIDDEVQPEEDYFKLSVGIDQIGRTYEIEAQPESDNYNLGITVYDESQSEIDSDDDSINNKSARVSLVPEETGTYYFKIYQLTENCTGGTYSLSVDVSGAPWDDYEPNDDPNEAKSVRTASNLNFYPYRDRSSPDVDWFRVWAKAGRTYEARTSNLNWSGVDTYLVVFDTNVVTVATDTSDGYESYVEWTPSQDDYYYIRVENKTQSDDPDYTYDLTIEQKTEDEEEIIGDRYEDNDAFDQTANSTLPVATSVNLESFKGNATFHNADDEDWFRFWVKDGKWYQATTSDLDGIDTRIEVRDRDNKVVEKDDDGGGGYASQARWQGGYDGYYYIRVTNKVNTSGSYDMTVQEVGAPESEPEPTAAPPNQDADRCDKNNLGNSFEDACIIARGKAETFNFIPPYGGTDNDFFKLWIKPGFTYKCATSDLDPGVDTNIILFSGPSWDHGIGGNDDVEPGEYRSAFTYHATYEGWLYILVGYGERTPSDVNDSSYTLVCSMPGEPTTTPAPEATNTPQPDKDEPTLTPTPTATSASSPVATPTPNNGGTGGAQSLTIRTLATPTPASVEATAAPRFVPITLLVYYDANDDRQPGAGEGIAGISAQAYSVADNQLQAQGFTGEDGQVEFTVSAQGSIRISVPFLGFNQMVTGESASIYLRVPPQSSPGGTASNE
jgi:hypothetical protein